jgi:MscS family membrane protein
MLRLAGAIVGAIGVVLMMAAGGQAIGLPVLSVLAGLGIGGIAVALAVRPTLENLIGGVILYVDRPVCVGDFCTFGAQTGTVEAIGIRSTQLRALDRTLISVPNAQFADMQIINWAECDEMLAHSVVGVRYETTPDQLRFLLAQFRRMLHAHPRINSDTVRVRFTGFGESSLTIDIRAYVMTREWNDFFAVREDIYFRIFEIVGRSGTSFAFPSQTLYMRRDAGVDQTRTEEIENAVAEWRLAGQLPFPRLTPDEIARLKGTLDYPAKGSPEADTDDTFVEVPGAEPLSAAQNESDRHGDETARQETGRPVSRSSRRDSE